MGSANYVMRYALGGVITRASTRPQGRAYRCLYMLGMGGIPKVVWYGRDS